MKYIVANWKANKTLEEAQDWLRALLVQTEKNVRVLQNLEYNNVKIIIAPPAPFIEPLFEQVKNYKNIVLAAQDLSAKEGGSFTGEITAHAYRHLVEYVIVGHSERRKNFNETYEIIQNKLYESKKYSLHPILCIRNKEDYEKNQAEILAYEPVEAIGTGNNATIEDVLQLKKSLHLTEKHIFLYGGSVTSANAHNYLSSSEIDGLLIGTASLDVNEFFNIVALV